MRHRAATARFRGLAIENKARLPDLASGLHDPRIAAGPVIAVASEQTHAITVPLYAEAVAIVLHFMEPVGPGGTTLPAVGMQNSKVLRISER